MPNLDSCPSKDLIITARTRPLSPEERDCVNSCQFGDIAEQFVSITHDLKSPLRHISYYLNMAIERATEVEPDTQLLDYLLKGDETIDSALRLISNLMEYFDPKRGKDTFRMNSVLREAITLQNGSMDRTGAKISIPDEDVYVEFNRKHLIRILSNLINNSLKYKHPDREPRINISTSSCDDRLTIRYQDNGIGISKEHWEWVFEMFMRGNHDQDGSGLGLALCKKLLKKEGGDIRISDSSDAGTTFEFFIPK